MDAVRLRFTIPGQGELEVPLDYAVVHMPKPRHARTDGADTPLFDSLASELGITWEGEHARS
jgi:hypothetical protein